MPRVPGIEQNSPAWLKVRRGMITASRVGDIMNKTKNGKWSSKRESYWEEKLAEIMTHPGYSATHFVSEAMIWGTECQPLARSAYEARKEVFVEDGGFWVHDEIGRLAASPDYLVGEKGLIEIKCRTPENHLHMVRTHEVPEPYIWQMQCQMACTGREWCDFVAFDPRVEPQNRLWIIRCDRNRNLVQALETEVRQFLIELEQEIQKLRKDGN